MNQDARAMVLGAAAGVLASLGMLILIDTRPDPFTGSDASMLRLDLERKMQKLENRINRLPPRATKDRIESLENWARKKGYQPPHAQWQWQGGP